MLNNIRIDLTHNIITLFVDNKVHVIPYTQNTAINVMCAKTEKDLIDIIKTLKQK